MNKQELIDKAVEQFCGKYPAKYPENIILSYRDGCEKRRNSYYPFYVCHTESKYDICTKIEFEKRARELGWINGYKYGVEYETNGKKPDLPDDLISDFKFNNAAYYSEWTTNPSTLGAMNFNRADLVAFRIVDDRYKPAEQKPVYATDAAKMAHHVIAALNSDWYDYTQQKAIELPPVGVECEIWELDGIWRKVEVVAHTKKGLVVEWNGEEHLIYRERKFRPLKTEREWFIEAASKIMHQTEDGVINDISLGQLYDAGCRFTENKAAS